MSRDAFSGMKMLLRIKLVPKVIAEVILRALQRHILVQHHPVYYFRILNGYARNLSFLYTK